MEVVNKCLYAAKSQTTSERDNEGLFKYSEGFKYILRLLAPPQNQLSPVLVHPISYVYRHLFHLGTLVCSPLDILKTCT